MEHEEYIVITMWHYKMQRHETLIRDATLYMFIYGNLPLNHIPIPNK